MTCVHLQHCIDLEVEHWVNMSCENCPFFEEEKDGPVSVRKHLMYKCCNCNHSFWWDAAFYGPQCPKCGCAHVSYTGVSRSTPVPADAKSAPLNSGS